MSRSSAIAANALGGAHVVVCGGTSGIGLALARGFAAGGCSVIATGSSTMKISAIAREPAVGLDFALLDVRDRGAPAAFFAGLSRLDVLVNCQGIARPEAEWANETFDEVVDVNLASVQRMSLAARRSHHRRNQCAGLQPCFIPDFCSFATYSVASHPKSGHSCLSVEGDG